MSIPLIYQDEVLETISVTRTQRIHHPYESIEYHEKYIGKRIYRGLFEASKGFRINSDVNGSYNFLRKITDKVLNNKIKFDYVYPKFNVYDIIEGVVVHGLVPERLSISDLMTKSYKQLKLTIKI